MSLGNEQEFHYNVIYTQSTSKNQLSITIITQLICDTNRVKKET